MANDFRKLIKILTLTLAAVFIVMVAASIWMLRTPTLGGDFDLNYKGTNWIFTDHAKKINLLYVGYAKCPDVCPMSLASAAQAFQKLSMTELENVQLAFISVDVDHDTPDSVALYASQFNPTFIGLTGTKTQIDSAIEKFGASYMVEENPKSYLGYSISHTDRIFILNKKGIVIDSVPNPRTGDEVLTKIREHL